MKRKSYFGRAAAVLTAVLMAVSTGSACGTEELDNWLKDYEEDDSVSEDGQSFLDWLLSDETDSSDSEDAESGTSMYDVNANAPDPNAASDEGSWRILVYMCGSDLETEDGDASADIYEMCSKRNDSDYSYYVAAGGAAYWQDIDIWDNEVEFLNLDSSEPVSTDALKYANMGDPETLITFLQSEGAKQPADHTGLVFWNHGSGSINGVCFDENYEDDSLTLQEIEYALSETGSHFDFIGFDACLMATMETAAVLTPYADYMIASEETESGIGWDYEAINAYLNAHVGANPEELGAAICNGMYAACRDIDEEDMATLSVVNLQKFPEFLKAFNSVAAELSGSASEPEALGSITKGIRNAENYGGNTPSEGYTNMVDVGSILENIRSEVKYADYALEKLSDMVVYQVTGQTRGRAHGLSVYYPLSVEGSDELRIFSEICPSKNYLSFVKQMVYLKNYGDLTDYVNTVDVSSDEYSYPDTLGAPEVSDAPVESEVPEEEFAYVDDPDIQAECKIELVSEPALLEDGTYSCRISEESFDYVSSVQCAVYASWDDDSILYYLGNDNDVYVEEDGTVSDNFGGEWIALPDGQLLSFYVVEENDTYDVFSAPVLLNGARTNLRFIYDYEESEYRVLGCYDGIDTDTGVSARDLRKLVNGDLLTPLYTAIDLESDDEDCWEEEGEAYTVSGDVVIEYYILPEGDYYYAFDLYDIYDNDYLTDFTIFYVDEEGDLYYY